MSTVHPVVPLDTALIDDIASRMALRVPNREGLEAIAAAFDKSGGDPFEVVLDVATAVGKTYLAGGLVEYLAESGVRNFVFVVPGRTILTKTVNNLTPGHPKSILGGMETKPLVITSENFNTGTTGAALHDDTVVKCFVFSVQSLIRPTDRVTRRTRQRQEWLGEELYRYLQDCDDLCVIADECHIYSERAAAFSDAVRALDAMATIGLTATPARTDLPKVIYKYPLARAIADRLVKTPVLVGRKDEARDVETQLRDGALLLAAKRDAIEAYRAERPGARAVNPVMFVVADTIENADLVANILRKPGLFQDNYDDAVLVVHSESPDDSLARLEAVEDPDSSVRVIVSVSMLKEGWDVSNIFVICSLRASISDVLTEQTLGRGLRLPWGAYTDVELLDTVEVLSHERYADLLAKAGVLLEGLVQQRIQPTVAPVSGSASDGLVAVTAGREATGAMASASSDADSEATGEDLPTGETGFVVADLEDRVRQAREQVEALQVPVDPIAGRELRIPRVERHVTAPSFTLSDVRDDAFVDLGRQLASVGGTTLARHVLDVVADGAGGFRLVPREGQVIDASTPALPLGGAKRQLRDAMCQLDFVAQDRQNLNAADRLADAVVEGAGSEDALAAYLPAAIQAVRRIVQGQFRHTPPNVTRTIEDDVFAPHRVNAREVVENRFGDFSRKNAYRGWTKSLYPIDWFDSKPERDLANVLDEDVEVLLWTRIQRGELTVEWESGRYSPDFCARANSGSYLLEMKADRDVQLDDVQAKKAAAESWARHVTDDGRFGTWQYLLVPESVLRTARTLAAIAQQSPYAAG